MDCILEIVKFLWEPAIQQIHYIKDLDKNVEDLKRKRDELSSRESDLNNEIERAKLEQRILRSEVDNWLKEVEVIKHQVSLIEKEYEESIKGFFPNYYEQRNLSKRALETISPLDRLYENGKFEQGVAVLPLPTTAHVLPTASLIGRTAEKAKNQILNWIKDKNVGIIGVHGMGGVCKTTIMKNVNNHLKDVKLFNYIFWVTVSRDSNLKKLQMDIAKEVGLALPRDEIEERMATVLHEALISRQRFLIILDDTWKPFALEKIGIPEPNQENGCKVALTTREYKVCQGMKTQKTLSVEILPEDEAWALFEDRVGRDTLLASNVLDLGRCVARECGGLPLALNTVGAALRDVNEAYEWKHALNQLRRSPFQFPDMQDAVFAQLKFSYDLLNNEKIRSCFLYCSLYPEDCSINVNEVIRYWIWEGLIDEDGSMDDQINEGHAIVNGLIRACMLQNDCETIPITYVKMHDLLRDMAIGITKNNPRFIARAATELEEPLKNEEWVGDVQRVSLMENRINSLSIIPNWPKLTTLFLQRNHHLHHLSPSFFQNMRALTVLDLSETDIKCLSDSLSELVNLRALLLSGCHHLSEIPSLAKLKELRVLHLSSTAISELPLGIEGLGNLRLLSLFGTPKLQTIQPGIISKLTHLETLEMMYSSYILQECILLDEIAALRRLAHLTLSIPDLSTFTRYVKSGHAQNLRKFTFTVGGTHMPPFTRECSVYVQGSQDSTEENEFMLPGNTLALHLGGWGQLSLFSLLTRSNMRGLKLCYISCCNTVEYIWPVAGDASFLSTLEELYLYYLGNLQVVSQGVAWHGIFQSLKLIVICGCPKLEYVFRAGMLNSLQNLEDINVSWCDKMVELVSEDEGDITEVSSSGYGNTLALPKLNSILLFKVRNLQRICSKLLVCNSMGLIKIEHCPKLKKISLAMNTSPVQLEGSIEGERAWWEALEWDDPATKELLLPHFLEKKNDPLEEQVETVN